MDSQNDFFTDLMKKNIYAYEKDNYGHAYIILNQFVPSSYNAEQKKLFVQHIIKIVNESLLFSRKNGKNSAYVHLYLTKCTRHNFNLAWFKKINNVLANEFEDTLETLYIYSDSGLFSNLWKIIKNFIDKDTKKKVVLVKC